MIRRMLTFCLTAVLGAALAGCSEDAATGPGSALSQQDADDLAVQAGQMLSAGSAGAAAELDAAFDDDSSLSTAPRAGLAPSLAASGDTIVIGGVTITITRTFYDSTGAVLPGYGPEAVRMVVESRVVGDFEGPAHTASIRRSGFLEVTGIAMDEDTLTFEGAGRDTTECRFTSFDGMRSRWYYRRASVSIDQVRKLKDRSANPYPLSGVMTWDVFAQRRREGGLGGIERTFEGTVVVTFNGTRYPTIVINGTWTYRVDLDTGMVTRL